MRIIAVVNQKGGVGKTTTSVNLGAALALRGRRVLLVDMDPQGNLTDHLLGDAPEGEPRASVYDVLVEGKPILDAIVPTTTPGLHVLPSHEDLAGAELDLASVIGREVLLRDALADVPEASFDYVLLDCPPSLGLLSLNALAAAHEVFIALQTEFFAMRGLGALDRTVDLVKRRINPTLTVTGIVPTLVDATRLSREVVDEVRGHYGELVFTSRVRSNIRLAEAPSHGKHIFDYAPDSPGAADYAALAKEVEEGRAAVEAPAEAPIAPPRTEGAPPATAAATAAPPRLRGIARAIQEATADVVAGAGLPRPTARPAPGARGGMVGTGPAAPTPATRPTATPVPAVAPVSAAVEPLRPETEADAPPARTAIEGPRAPAAEAPPEAGPTPTEPKQGRTHVEDGHDGGPSWAPPSPAAPPPPAVTLPAPAASPAPPAPAASPAPPPPPRAPLLGAHRRPRCRCDADAGRRAPRPAAVGPAPRPAQRPPPAQSAADAHPLAVHVAATDDASPAGLPAAAPGTALTAEVAAHSAPHPFEVEGRPLAGLLTRPAGPPRGSVVVLHPHPGHGGHMDHSVVRTAAERAAAAGLVALRFDVGGVRTSVGDVHDRAAHLRELRVAVAVAERFAPGLPRYGAGFSYGARLWMEAVLRPDMPSVAGLLLLAPATRVPRSSRDFGDLLLGRPIRDAALDAHSLARLAAIPVPARILVGERDNVAPPDEVRAHAAAIAPVVVLAGVNHFFSRAVGAGATAYDLLGPAIDAAWSELVR